MLVSRRCACQLYSYLWVRVTKTQQLLRLTLGVRACVRACAGCFEYRVVFTSLAGLVRLSPPWSYLCVTLALYSLPCVWALHTTGYARHEHVAAIISKYP